MALLEILRYPDSRLRRKSQKVDRVTAELKELANDMLETMYDFNGIGLAAAQVDQLVRLFVMDTRPRDDEDKERYDTEGATELEKKIGGPVIVFNPEIIEREGKTIYREGCLSLPSYFETVERFDWIKLRGLDHDGKELELELDGLMSICAQHEIDHLDGKLFIDRLSLIKGDKIKRLIKKHGYPDPEEEEEEEEEKIDVRDAEE